MAYDETKQKLILREMESDLLAIVAIDLAADEYEIIYTDGAYRDFGNRYRNKDFFAAWRTVGLSLVFESDRERLMRELSREHLLEKLLENDAPFYTMCRFLIDDVPTYCRIKVVKDVVESGNLIISIRNVDQETRSDAQRLAEVEELHRRACEIIELERELEQMRARNFINQMHPHFLFNALASIREIVLTDPEYGADMLYDFTTHLRASIWAMSNDDEIWFSQELENIKAYVSIERMRFGDCLQVVYDIADGDFRVIPLCIQPLVENAIKHGLFEAGADGGTVVLRTRETPDCWEVAVADDGVGFDSAAVFEQIDAGERDSAGLRNLMFRLRSMMGASVDLASAVGEGTKAVVRFPKDRVLQGTAQRENAVPGNGSQNRKAQASHRAPASVSRV